VCKTSAGSKIIGGVTTQDFIKFWGKFFFAFVLLEMFEISQGFKTF
jgi:uncharacterized membrane protein (DUF373 family)